MKQFEFDDLSVAAVYKSYPGPVRARLLALRQLIFELAERLDGVEISETLKWGVPSYQSSTKTGTPIRLASAKEADSYGLYVHCQTSLIDDFKKSHPDAFRYSGTRALLFALDDKLPEKELEEFILAALTYHQRKSHALKA
ncbi:DUF1801 domain-containing protein [uncultured Sneathiella sp.]|uniref:DUF1801 domain-containing protein n=1 Tax=uncultured Sneathiella sp. TaxID=879315 RepID=UPI0030ECD7B0|tara:strand:+ start:48625 stop:49047 length:423 start_codon:yes stop_codon:yes gene_type:complete